MKNMLDLEVHSLLFKLSGKVIGGCVFKPHWEMGSLMKNFANKVPTSFVELLYLGVSLDHQGKGVGSQIITELKVWAQEQHLTFIVTFADDNEFEDFFRKQGFSDECPVLK